ncbi:aldehyde dehydrogenase family protein [Massilia cavernae]|uniref:Aldehyde dehydrogenase family protein n=1 Tax=Massilia cavernae TaxID=2320864 RepID=A0A418XQV8_9BURK|nr:aldehyde dehydrogenase family protein [Massilia cavernae]RJG14869.1 aldehyde dehydrogenase family protein [Massilia cavernae]
MTTEIVTISPIDGRIVVRRECASPAAITQVLTRARAAQPEWKRMPLAQRAALVGRAVDALVANKEAIARELTLQMGRPIRYAGGEVDGFENRARHMIAIAQESLADVVPTAATGFVRFIRREALGVVLVVAPWNYPLLTAVNAIVPALLAGNTVLLKHSAQTPLVAERLAEAFAQAGLPPGVFQIIQTTHDDTCRMIASPEVDFVCFTGSVAGGVAVEKAAAGRFIGVGLELGACDPAYVRADADIAHAVDSLVDGAFFNSGQSCCGIQRLYVHQSVYGEFIERAAALARQYVLGDPLDPATTLGPLVRTSAAAEVRSVVADAIGKGAHGLVDPRAFGLDNGATAYMAPQILTGVDHGMRIMADECFGPVCGVMPVASDEQAIALMNDSQYGLSAALYTRDAAAAVRIGEQVDTGTLFMNRCDYLDPALAWTGIKNSGRGATLSSIGFEHLTRPKSFHLKTIL